MVSIPELKNLSTTTRSFQRKLVRRFHHDWETSPCFDISIVSGRRNFKVHRLILAASSGYFYNIFVNEAVIGDQLVLNTIENDELDIILKYMYTGIFDLNAKIKDLESIKKSMEMLEIVNLGQHRCSLMTRFLSHQHFKHLWNLASMYRLAEIDKKITKFVAKNLPICSENQEFLQMSIRQIIAVFSCEEIRQNTEQCQMNAVCNWILYYCPERDKYTCSLLATSKIANATRLRILSVLDEHVQNGKSLYMPKKRLYETFTPCHHDSLQDFNSSTEIVSPFSNNVMAIGTNQLIDTLNTCSQSCNPVSPVNRCQSRASIMTNQTETFSIKTNEDKSVDMSIADTAAFGSLLLDSEEENKLMASTIVVEPKKFNNEKQSAKNLKLNSTVRETVACIPSASSIQNEKTNETINDFKITHESEKNDLVIKNILALEQLIPRKKRKSHWDKHIPSTHSSPDMLISCSETDSLSTITMACRSKDKKPVKTQERRNVNRLSMDASDRDKSKSSVSTAPADKTYEETGFTQSCPLDVSKKSARRLPPGYYRINGMIKMKPTESSHSQVWDIAALEDTSTPLGLEIETTSSTHHIKFSPKKLDNALKLGVDSLQLTDSPVVKPEPTSLFNVNQSCNEGQTKPEETKQFLFNDYRSDKKRFQNLKDKLDEVITSMRSKLDSETFSSDTYDTVSLTDSNCYASAESEISQSDMTSGRDLKSTNRVPDIVPPLLINLNDPKMMDFPSWSWNNRRSEMDSFVKQNELSVDFKPQLYREQMTVFDGGRYDTKINQHAENSFPLREEKAVCSSDPSSDSININTSFKDVRYYTVDSENDVCLRESAGTDVPCPVQAHVNDKNCTLFSLPKTNALLLSNSQSVNSVGTYIKAKPSVEMNTLCINPLKGSSTHTICTEKDRVCEKNKYSFKKQQPEPYFKFYPLDSPPKLQEQTNSENTITIDDAGSFDDCQKFRNKPNDDNKNLIKNTAFTAASSATIENVRSPFEHHEESTPCQSLNVSKMPKKSKTLNINLNEKYFTYVDDSMLLENQKQRMFSMDQSNRLTSETAADTCMDNDQNFILNEDKCRGWISDPCLRNEFGRTDNAEVNENLQQTSNYDVSQNEAQQNEHEVCLMNTSRSNLSLNTPTSADFTPSLLNVLYEDVGSFSMSQVDSLDKQFREKIVGKPEEAASEKEPIEKRCKKLLEKVIEHSPTSFSSSLKQFEENEDIHLTQSTSSMSLSFCTKDYLDPSLTFIDDPHEDDYHDDDTERDSLPPSDAEEKNKYSCVIWSSYDQTACGPEKSITLSLTNLEKCGITLSNTEITNHATEKSHQLELSGRPEDNLYVRATQTEGCLDSRSLAQDDLPMHSWRATSIIPSQNLSTVESLPHFPLSYSFPSKLDMLPSKGINRMNNVFDSKKKLGLPEPVSQVSLDNIARKSVSKICISETRKTWSTATKSVYSSPATGIIEGPLLILLAKDSAGNVGRLLYNLKSRMWLPFQPLKVPRPHDDYSSCCNGGYIYFIGGITSASCQRLRTAYEYDCTCDTIRRLPDMIVARSGAAVSAIDDNIYVIGGMGMRHSSLAQVERYEPCHDTWRLLAPLLKARSNMSVITLKQLLYVFGGTTITASGNEFPVLVSCERYDSLVNQWTSIANLPTQFESYNPLVACVGRKIYAIRLQNPDHVFRFNIAQDRWIMLQNTKSPLRRIGILLSGENKLYAMEICGKVIYAFDLHSYQWNVEAELPKGMSWTVHAFISRFAK